MHRYVARFLGCLIISLAVLLLSITVPHQGRKRVTVRTDGQTADLVAAIEALKRKDITLEVEDDVWITNPVGSFVGGALAMAAVLWIATSAVKRFEFLYEKKEPNQRPEPKA